MKTVKEWFLWADAQGYEWAHKAHYNLIVNPLYKNSANKIVDSLVYALDNAFLWSESMEGQKYWIMIDRELKRSYTGL